MTEAEEIRALKKDRRITAALADYRRTDNVTNWLFIGRAWLVILAVAGFACWFYLDGRARMGLPWLANVPVTLLAVLVVGASQHQLAGAGHEATHGILFRNRLLNELASDWLCMFPLFTSTHAFRVYHLAHHQYVNDPERDPDFAMLAASGHWLKFPVSKSAFLRKLGRQLLVLDLVRYTLTRFLFNGAGSGLARSSAAERGTAWPKVIGAAFFVATWATALALRESASLAALLGALFGILGCGAALMLALPDRHYETTRVPPPYPARWLAASRMAFFTLLFLAIALVHRYTTIPAGPLFALLWGVPLLTSFGFCMILRQLVQHGNADRGWLTNTRVFLMNPLVRYAVFPFGMDYHTPHHMYASVPHYRLPGLHEFLLQFEPYRRHCVEVRNYLLPEPRTPPRPTVLEVLSRENCGSGEVWMDNSVAPEQASGEADTYGGGNA